MIQEKISFRNIDDAFARVGKEQRGTIMNAGFKDILLRDAKAKFLSNVDILFLGAYYKADGDSVKYKDFLEALRMALDKKKRALGGRDPVVEEGKDPRAPDERNVEKAMQALNAEANSKNVNLQDLFIYGPRGVKNGLLTLREFEDNIEYVRFNLTKQEIQDLEDKFINRRSNKIDCQVLLNQLERLSRSKTDGRRGPSQDRRPAGPAKVGGERDEFGRTLKSNKDEFRKIRGQLNKEKTTEKFITRIFDTDRTESGYITYSQIKECLRLCRANFKEDIIRGMLADVNTRPGTRSDYEIQNMMEQLFGDHELLKDRVKMSKIHEETEEVNETFRSDDKSILPSLGKRLERERDVWRIFEEEGKKNDDGMISENDLWYLLRDL